jgi:hypothetical protein
LSLVPHTLLAAIRALAITHLQVWTTRDATGGVVWLSTPSRDSDVILPPDHAQASSGNEPPIAAPRQGDVGPPSRSVSAYGHGWKSPSGFRSGRRSFALKCREPWCSLVLFTFASCVEIRQRNATIVERVFMTHDPGVVSPTRVPSGVWPVAGPFLRPVGLCADLRERYWEMRGGM